MKKIISTALAAALLVSICGCGKEEKKKVSHIVDRPGVVATVAPKTETEPDITISPEGTLAPMEGSIEVETVSADEVATSQTVEEFEDEPVEPGYMRYEGGDTRWGIVLPSEARVGDEAEDSSLFVVGPNIVTAVVVDREIVMTSVAEVMEHYSDMGAIIVDDFTVIRDDGKYIGCYFEFLNEDGARGFSKYVVNNGKTVSAAGINTTQDAAQDQILRDMVNSVVIFE